jgi:DNA-binding CsgD family transcriptional regulator
VVERVFEGSRNAMLIADDSRRYTHANPAASALLETPRERLLTMAIDDFTPTEMRDRLEHLWQAFTEAGTQAGKYTLQLPSGRRLEVEYSATANIAPGQHLSVFLNPALGQHGESAPSDDRIGRLTPREREIVGLVALGVTTQEMAERLIISPETVRTHVKSAIEKLGARNRAHAVVLAIRSDQVDVLDD